MDERSSTTHGCAGEVARACTQGKRTQHGKPQGVVSDGQPDARGDRLGALGCSHQAALRALAFKWIRRHCGPRPTTRDKNRMREFRTYGSVRGVPSNGHPYRDPRPIAVCRA